MIYVGIVALVIFLGFSLFFYMLNCISDINNLKVKIEEAKKEISILQEENINLMTNISKFMKTKTDEKVFVSLPKIKNKSLDIFALDGEVNGLNRELKQLLENNNYELSDDESIFIKDIKNNFMELKAIKLYYNDNANDYNKDIKKFKYLIIKMFKKLHEVPIFSIEKEIEFEILK